MNGSRPGAPAEGYQREDCVVMKLRIAYQGEPGANSHIACLEVFPMASRSP
jgi:hypothetical protein